MNFIQGTLVKITPFKQLIVKVSELTHRWALKCKLVTWEYEQNFYMRVNLDDYDKQILRKKFEPMLKKRVGIKGAIETYLGTTYFKLSSIFLKKSTGLEAEIDEIAQASVDAALNPQGTDPELEAIADEYANPSVDTEAELEAIADEYCSQFR